MSDTDVPMSYRQLGRTGCFVSAIGFGTWLTVGKETSPDSVAHIVSFAIERGVNFFDTADIYADGMAEEILGKALATIQRDEFIIATKVGGRSGRGPNARGLSRKHLISSLERSLRRLRVDFIDLYQLHVADPETECEETLETLDYLFRQGKIAYWGVSNYSTEQMLFTQEIAKASRRQLPVSNQVALNLLYRDPAAGEGSWYASEGLFILAYSPLAEGCLAWGDKEDQLSAERDRIDAQRRWLTTKGRKAIEQLKCLAETVDLTLPQLALAGVLRFRHVASAIVGVRSIDQMKENLGSLAATGDVSFWEAVSEVLKDAELCELPIVNG